MKRSYEWMRRFPRWPLWGVMPMVFSAAMVTAIDHWLASGPGEAATAEAPQIIDMERPAVSEDRKAI